MADGLFNPSRLYEALAAQGLLPQVAKQNSPETGDPGYYSAFNKVFLGRNEAKDVAAHEMTHAVQSNIIQAAAKSITEKKNKTDQEKQFLAAYQKLMVGAEGLPVFNMTEALDELSTAYKKSASALYGSPITSTYDKYRTSPREAQAFGVGNMSTASQPFIGVQRHMDPTYTTEFDILLSMYDKLSDSVKKSASDQRKKDIKSSTNFFSRQNRDLEQSAEFIDLFSDPFAPTIK
jgi:hypothetical protein